MGTLETTKGNVERALAHLDWSKSIEVKDSWNHDGLIAVIEIQYHDITFEDLQAVSEALGTTKINVDSETREGGYCETCRYSYSVTVLTVMGIKIPEPEPEPPLE